MMASLLSHWTLSTPYALAVGIGAGALVGLFHFLSLKKNAGFYLEGNFGWALLLQCLRFAVLLVVFVALAKLGPWALLSGAASLLAVRTLVVSREWNPG